MGSSAGRRDAAAAAAERLSTYRGMRDFDRTPEPAGAAADQGGAPARRFVVQRHRASRLHDDLRFEIDGVLVSWAVPKGPTLDPGSRRLAVHVEDHPVEYADFEGVIPSGEYGGGDVIVWNRGTWEPHPDDDPGEAVRRGELHAEMHGEKLPGRLVLVRREDGDGGKDEWLLLHTRDRYAVPGWDPEEHPRPVLSGRTNDEVKADPERVWRSDLPAADAAVGLRNPVLPAPTDDELAALDELPATGGAWEVFGRRLRVTNLDEVLVLARLHRTAFEHLGVRAQPKVTGRRGIQVWVPIERGPTFAETREWAERLSRTVGAVVPELVSWRWEVRERKGLARLDYTQNAINKTLVAPYSPRTSAAAPVSAPIAWAELDDPALRSDGFTIRTILGRPADRGDLFRPVLAEPQTLPPLG